LSGIAMIIKINPIMNIKEVSFNCRKRVKNKVPIAKQPTASSVEVLPSKGASWVTIVVIVK
jgi:hypothetical protein